jgi:non-ribosomal peptide synthase protein (TIGR01720 family)
LTTKLGSQPSPEVIFNYLGHERTHRSSDASFRRIPDGFGHTRSGSAQRASVFEINSWVAEGRLAVAWSYSRNLHHRDTVQRLITDVIDCLATLARRDYGLDRTGLTPSDFPDADLNQDDLDRLADRLE